MTANDNLPILAARTYREVQAQLHLRDEVSACAVFEATRAALNMREEDCAGAIYDAMSLAIRQGLVGCNTFDLCENSIIYGAQTVLTPLLPLPQ